MYNGSSVPPGQAQHSNPSHSRNRATTRVTLNVPGEDKRPRTPDTFERDFNSFFRRNGPTVYDQHHPFENDPFSDFSTRNHSRLFQDLQNTMPGCQIPSYSHHSPNSSSGPYTSPSSRPMNANPSMQHTHQVPQPQNTQSNPLSGYSFSQPQPPTSHTSVHNSQHSGQSDDRRGRQSSQQSSRSPNECRGSPQPPPTMWRQSSSQYGSGCQSSPSPPQSQSQSQSQSQDTKESSREVEDLKTHGPTYSMFKVDDPQMDISEEFPNRERIRKISLKRQNSGGVVPTTPKYNIYDHKSEEAEGDSAAGASSSDCTTISEETRLPDWQANVQVGEGFLKRHLSAKRQGHTVHVVANKVTESVHSGRQQLTREWRVVAPEIVDAQSIRSDYVEGEKKLVITGLFDTIAPLPIH